MVSEHDEADGDVPTFRIAVVAPFSPTEAHRTAAPPEPNLHRIDRASFDEVVAKLVAPLALEVADPFGGKPLTVDVRIQALRDFRPDGLVDVTPALASLMEARRVIDEGRTAKRGAAELRAHLARLLPREAWAETLVPAPSAGTPSPSTASSGPAAASLDSLLDQVALPAAGTDEKAVKDPVGSLISAVAKGAKGRPAGATGHVARGADDATRTLLASILAHEELHRLERLWRSLRLVVDQADARRGVEVYVVAAEEDELGEVLTALTDDGSGEAFDLLVLGTTLDASARMLELAKTAAAVGESAHSPVFVSGSAELVGAADLAALGRSSRRLATQDDPRSVAFRSAMDDPSTQWLFVAVNGVFLRAPYDAQSSRLRGLSFTQKADEAGSWVVAHPAFALAALTARRFSESGFPSPILAPEMALSGLTVREHSELGVTAALAVEAPMSDAAARELADAGIVAFSGIKNRDAAHVLVARAAHRPRGAVAGKAQSTLADAFFVGGLVRALNEIKSALPSSASEQKIGRAVEALLLDMYSSGSPNGPEVFASAKGGVLHVRVVPHRFGGATLEELSLELPLRD